MRYLFLISGLFLCQFSFAQSFVFPKLPVQSNAISALIPQNWKAIDTAFGDLNNDQTEDMALILEYHQAVSEKRAYGDGDTELIKEFQKPRILAVYFKDIKSGKYIFALQNNNFILRSQEGGILGEPLKKLNIQDNKLNMVFEGGNEWRWKLDYVFKFQHKDWDLIQASHTYYNSSSGEMTIKAYDFTNRKVKQTKGNLFTRNNTNEVSEEILYFSQLRTLNNFKKPWTWEITKDNFL
ncbi:hypothetical protein [Pedobacter sp. Hv1]|uniref:hypothetical protein n=1 Tax=Pedobacter sp. Hv1 TaxID=1740090 RepID=UPI0006D8BF19|nr:hypothetical protein [Pedobacter sp. Hv1]KQB98959.1 hypothetical protein AQF98_19715 [Pedobacter sp. Hv1]